MTLPLNNAPGPSPDEESERHALISRDFLVKAREELERGDLLQASEKAWGTVAHAVEAVAEKRRWFSEADWKLRRAALIIADETCDDFLMGSYSLTRDAHFNFYHHHYNARTMPARSSELSTRRRSWLLRWILRWLRGMRHPTSMKRLKV